MIEKIKELQNIIIQQQKLHYLEKQEFIKQFMQYKQQQADRIQDLLQKFNLSLEKVKQLNNITIQFPRPELQQVQRITQLETENAQLKISTKQQQQQIVQIRKEYKRFVDEVLTKYSFTKQDMFVTQTDENDLLDHLMIKQQLHIDSATQLSLQLLTKTISEMQGQFIQQDDEVNLLNKQIRELRAQCEKFGQQCDMQQMEIDQLRWQNQKLITQLDKTHLLNQIDDLQQKNMEITMEYQKQQQELLQAYTQLSTMKQIIDSSSIQAKQQINDALKLYESTKIGELQNRLIQQIEDSLHFSKMYKMAHDMMMKKEDINTELRLKICRYFNYNEHFIDQAKHYTEQQFQMYIQTLQDRILEQQTQISSLQNQNNIFNNQIVSVQKENFSLQQENRLLATTSSNMNKNVTLTNNQILQEKTAELQRRQIYQLQEQNDQLKKQNTELNEKYETEKITRNSQMLNMTLLCDLYKIMYVKLKYQDISQDLNEFVIKQIDKLSKGQDIKYFIPPKIIEELLKAEINVYEYIDKNKYLREALLQQKTSLKMNQQVTDSMIQLRLNDQRIHVTKDQSSYIDKCLDNITKATTVFPTEQQQSVIFQDVKSRDGNTEKLVIFKQSANIPLTLAAIMTCGSMPIQRWDDEVQVGESVNAEIECQTDTTEQQSVEVQTVVATHSEQKEQRKNFRQIKQVHKQKELQKEPSYTSIRNSEISQQHNEQNAQSIEQSIKSTENLNVNNTHIQLQTIQSSESQLQFSVCYETTTSEEDVFVIESSITLNDESVPIIIKKRIIRDEEEQYLPEDESKSQNQFKQLNETKPKVIENNSLEPTNDDIHQYQQIIKNVIETADVDYHGQKIVVIDQKNEQLQKDLDQNDLLQHENEQLGDDEQIVIRIKNNDIQAEIIEKEQISEEAHDIVQPQLEKVDSKLKVSHSSSQHSLNRSHSTKLLKQSSKFNLKSKQQMKYDQKQQQEALYNNIIKAQGLFLTEEQKDAREKLLKPEFKPNKESTVEEQMFIHKQVELMQKGLKTFDIIANINNYNQKKEQNHEKMQEQKNKKSFTTIKLEQNESKADNQNQIDESLYLQSITHNYSLYDMNQVLVNQLIDADKYVIHQKQHINYYSQQLMMVQEELYSTKLNYITRNYKLSNIDTIISQKINNNIELLRAQYYSQYDLFAQIFIEIQSQITFIANKMARLDLLKLINGLDMRLQEMNIKILQVKKRELHQRQQIGKFVNLIKKFGKLSDKVYEQMDSKHILNILLNNPNEIEHILIENSKKINIKTADNPIHETKNYSNLENLSEQQIIMNDIDIIDSISEVEVDKQQQEMEELERQIQLQTQQLEDVQSHFEENHQKEIEKATHFMAQTIMPAGLQQYKDKMEQSIQQSQKQLKEVVETTEKEVQAVLQNDSLLYEHQQLDQLMQESLLQSKLLSDLDENISQTIQQMKDQISDTVNIKQQLKSINFSGKTRTPSPGYKGRKNSYSKDQLKWEQNNNLLELIKEGLIKIITQSSINKQDQSLCIFIKQLSAVIELLRQANINNNILANKLITTENDFNIMKLSFHEQLHQIQAKQRISDSKQEHQLLEILFGPGPRPQTEARQLSAAGLRTSRHKWRRQNEVK